VGWVKFEHETDVDPLSSSIEKTSGLMAHVDVVVLKVFQGALFQFAEADVGRNDYAEIELTIVQANYLDIELFG